MTFFFFFLVYSTSFYFYVFSPHCYFFPLLNSESGGAPFLAQEEIMHYTGQVSQSFTKKLF